ncbi:MAG: hypothetical protein JWN99_2093, partial [Ilumatobacteraceae bacterium]|nr:hypothetical protein [Ilumatobacteraceae bacterium]
ELAMTGQIVQLTRKAATDSPTTALPTSKPGRKRSSSDRLQLSLLATD